jgi:hypothetical protein
MPLLLSEVYDALLEAGASDAKARSAATAIAGYENRLISIEAKVDRLDTRLTALDSKVTWMFGVGFSLLVLTLGGVLTVLWRQILL